MAIFKYKNSTLFDEKILSVRFSQQDKSTIEFIKSLVANNKLDGDFTLSVKVEVSNGTDTKIFPFRLKTIHFDFMVRQPDYFNWEDGFLTTIQLDPDIEVK